MNIHMIISGKVQGVGFRYTVQNVAKSLQLFGWVQNNSDGTVELEIEGNIEDIELFREKLKKGLSPFIRIDEINETITEKQKGYKDFTIKY